jgi:3-oxoacyl-(acyl-carrier-protein) synthase
MNDRRVVISGLGVVSPLGNSKETFWNNRFSDYFVKEFSFFILWNI